MVYYKFLIAILMLISCISIIFSNNTIISILFLILVFLLTSLLFLLVGADFLAVMLLIIYVGALSVLFCL